MKLDISIMHEEFLRSLSPFHFKVLIWNNVKWFPTWDKDIKRLLRHGYTISNKKVKSDICFYICICAIKHDTGKNEYERKTIWKFITHIVFLEWAWFYCLIWYLILGCQRYMFICVVFDWNHISNDFISSHYCLRVNCTDYKIPNYILQICYVFGWPGI